ncbi:MAG: alpha/beta hydrolase [Bdellovibrionales bacterium]|nr:alpha/beta hydrolase [Bdellovibrionales bacterium]
MKDLNYKFFGKGKKTLVFLHGLLGFWRNFYSISQAFTQNYKCLLYDQRGHGLSKHKAPYTIETLSKDLKALLSFLKQESVILIGHSLGGYVSSYFAYKESSLVEKLVLVDCCPWPKKEIQENIIHLLQMLPDSFNNRESAKVFFDEKVKQGLLSQSMSFFLMANLEKKLEEPISFLFDKTGLLNVPKTVRQINYDFFLKGLAIPTLCLRGENSHHFSKSEWKKTIQLNPLIQGIEIPKSGHWVHSQQAKTFIKVLKTFLNKT